MPEQRALEWLLAKDTGYGLPGNTRRSVGCPGATGACIETALWYGCRDEAIRWAQWLMSIQRSDGAMPDVLHGEGASYRCTAQAADGLLAILSEFPKAEPAARRACEYLGSSEAAHTPPAARLRKAGEECAGPRSRGPADVLALSAAGSRWPETGWLFKTQEVVGQWDFASDPLLAQAVCCEQSSARRVETLIAMGRSEAARTVLDFAASRLGGNGRLAVPWGEPLTARLAQLAVLWYKLDERDRADRALEYVRRRQQADGGFPAVLRRWPSPAMRYQDTWAAKYYLDAALLRVRAAFEARWQEFPDTIDPEDGRLQAAREWMATLPMSARVADVGCGKGRFLRHLLREFPAAGFTGIDISPAMLSMLPPGVTARSGSILRTGVADAELDGVMAVETLEHCLAPKRAVVELCRVVRPGGRILIIDKDRRKQALSEHDPWERWVTSDELSAWLSASCRDVRVFHVAHREGRQAGDLFLAATATREAA